MEAEGRVKEDKLRKEIDNLRTELGKSIDVVYLRQVFIQFLCSTGPVQDRLTEVIATLLQLNDEEKRQIFSYRGKGLLSRFFGT
mmetsp:Transcript_8008/g.1062  ORF Transcript_8008/g.1062 Transcript_8008/m.1062 type:complete len:84 (-) Transcript_8008:524-775(-)